MRKRRDEAITMIPRRHAVWQSAVAFCWGCSVWTGQMCGNLP